MLDNVQVDKPESFEVPAMQVLMQLDTPPCFKQKKQGDELYVPCPGCCTCLCPTPPSG